MHAPAEITIENSDGKSISEFPDGKNSKNIVAKSFDTFKNCVKEYFAVSSINGLRHLTTFGIFHRVFWSTMLVASITTCYFTNVKLFGSRKILILNEQNTVPTSNIPFPAVTICTTVKADHRKFNYKEVTQRNSNLSKKEYELLFF